MEIEIQTHHSELGHYTKTLPEDGLAVVCDYDYSDAPAWAVPREWFVEGRYDLDWELI